MAIEQYKQDKDLKGGLRTRERHKESTPDLPLITVITVVLNGDRHLEQAIQSVLHQGYGNIEYIVIDGGSTDRTLDIITKYKDEIDYLVSEPDKGIYDAMNKGINLAHGKLIGLLNADDYYEPDAIESVVNKYKANPSQQILFGNTYMLQEDMNLRYKHYSHTKYWLGMGICHPAMFVHKDIYKIIGAFNLHYRISADFDFMVRAILKKVMFVPVNKFLVNYRTGGFSAMNLPSTLRENRMIIKKYFNFFSFEHFAYLGLYSKSMTLLFLQKIIKFIFGDRLLDKARIWYLKKFFAKEPELLNKSDSQLLDMTK